MANNPTFASLTEARLGHGARLDGQATTLQTISGKNLFNSLGRNFFDVKFPVVFCDEPVHTSGSSLDTGTPFLALDAPIPCECTSMVVGWQLFGNVTGAWAGYYTGATIQAVIRGSKEQLTWVHWTFQGPALRNPVNSEDTVVLP